MPIRLISFPLILISCFLCLVLENQFDLIHRGWDSSTFLIRKEHDETLHLGCSSSTIQKGHSSLKSRKSCEIAWTGKNALYQIQNAQDKRRARFGKIRFPIDTTPFGFQFKHWKALLAYHSRFSGDTTPESSWYLSDCLNKCVVREAQRWQSRIVPSVRICDR